MIEEVSKLVIILLIAILALHIIQGNGQSWIKSKFQVAGSGK